MLEQHPSCGCLAWVLGVKSLHEEFAASVDLCSLVVTNNSPNFQLKGRLPWDKKLLFLIKQF